MPAPLGPTMPVRPAPSSSSVFSCWRKLAEPQAVDLHQPPPDRARRRPSGSRRAARTPRGRARPAAAGARDRSRTSSGSVCRRPGRADADGAVDLGPAEVEVKMQRGGLERADGRRGRARARRAAGCSWTRRRTILSATPPGTAATRSAMSALTAAADSPSASIGSRSRISRAERHRAALHGAAVEIGQQPALARASRGRPRPPARPRCWGSRTRASPAYQTRGATWCCTW